MVFDWSLLVSTARTRRRLEVAFFLVVEQESNSY